jgi:NAD(P)-dependent dehydrogenase (short-subunit alcohol dehydrogenase family)
VTGSTRGIGLALARGLRCAGAQVIVHGRDPAQAEAVAASRRDEGIAAGSRAFQHE